MALTTTANTHNFSECHSCFTDDEMIMTMLWVSSLPMTRVLVWEGSNTDILAHSEQRMKHEVLDLDVSPLKVFHSLPEIISHVVLYR